MSSLRGPFPDSSTSSALSKITTKGSRNSRRHWITVWKGEKCVACLLVPAKMLSNFETISSLLFTPRTEMKYVGVFLSRKWCATSMATDVFPNPGAPQMLISRLSPETNGFNTAARSSSRPTKSGFLSGRQDMGVPEPDKKDMTRKSDSENEFVWSICRRLNSKV